MCDIYIYILNLDFSLWRHFFATRHAKSLSWAFYRLACDQQLQQQVAEEVKDLPEEVSPQQLAAWASTLSPLFFDAGNDSVFIDQYEMIINHTHSTTDLFKVSYIRFPGFSTAPKDSLLMVNALWLEILRFNGPAPFEMLDTLHFKTPSFYKLSGRWVR